MYIEKQRNSQLKVWELHEGYTASSLLKLSLKINLKNDDFCPVSCFHSLCFLLFSPPPLFSFIICPT